MPSVQRTEGIGGRTYQKVIRITGVRKLHGGDVKVGLTSADVRKTKGAQGRKGRAGSVRCGGRGVGRRSHLLSGVRCV